jgi:hypothetical protein
VSLGELRLSVVPAAFVFNHRDIRFHRALPVHKVVVHTRQHVIKLSDVIRIFLNFVCMNVFQ